jgi:cytochrome P450
VTLPIGVAAVPAAHAAAALELALLALLSWPWSRLLLDPRRRLASIGPRVHAVLAALFVAGAAAAILAALFAPTLLHAATAIAAGAGVIAAWRGRSSRGRARGLPPGSLALSRSIEAVVDRDFYARAAHRYGPIFKMAQFHRPVVCVVGLERAHQLLRDRHAQLAPSPLPWSDAVRGGFLRYMDDGTHQRYGPLFRVALARAIDDDAERGLRRTARRELAAMATRASDGKDGDSADRGGVVPGPALDRIVLAAFARVLFGIEADSAAFADLARDYAVLREQRLTRPLTERSRAALDRLRTLVEERAGAARRSGPASKENRGCALEQLRRADPAMPDGVCVDNLIFILVNASENVGALLRWLIKLLGDHPQWCERLRVELESGAATAAGTAAGTPAGAAAEAPATPRLADRIVMETLRLAQSEYLYRAVRQEFELDGYVFPAGWHVRICLAESHRDAAVWPDAPRFDPDRFLGPPPRTRYAPFGLHQHACNGVDLNGLICRATLEELALGFDWSLARDGALERDFRHWSHWRPSARLAIAIAPRAGHTAEREAY